MHNVKKFKKHPQNHFKWKLLKKVWSYNLIINNFIKCGKKFSILIDIVNFFLIIKLFKLNIKWDSYCNFFNISNMFYSSLLIVPIFYLRLTKRVKSNRKLLSSKIFINSLEYCQLRFRNHLIKKIFIFLIHINSYNLKFKLIFWYNVFITRKSFINKFIFGYNRRAMGIFY